MVNSMYQRPNRDWHSVNQTKLMCKALEMDYEILRTLDPYRLVIINSSYFIDSWETWNIKYQTFESEQNPIYISRLSGCACDNTFWLLHNTDIHIENRKVPQTILHIATHFRKGL